MYRNRIENASVDYLKRQLRWIANLDVEELRRHLFFVHIDTLKEEQAYLMGELLSRRMMLK